MSYAELSALDSAATSEDAPAASDADVWAVLDNGVREIAGEVRNSLDFHRSQDGGGEVASIVLSGPALQISGFATALQNELRVPITPQTAFVPPEDTLGPLPPPRLATPAARPPAPP